MRVLSGIQPSGKLHLGNYFGMMKRMIEYQNQHDLFCFIVDLHALTTLFDGEKLRENTLSAAADFLALGLDPEKCTFWVQSQVPEVAELTWYLSNVTPFGLLERATSYKDKVEKGIPASHGLFSYPVLMAADILLYQSQIIPVGKDQKQHIEITRDIAIKFNNLYGETFVLPEPQIARETALVPGVDGLKMSKSYDNTIEIFASKKAMKKKVMSIKTDSKTLEEEKDPEGCVIFDLYCLFSSKEEQQELAQKYRAGNFGYGHAKMELLEKINQKFEPLREKKNSYLKDIDYLQDILNQGAKKARLTAQETLDKVRSKVGVLK